MSVLVSCDYRRKEIAAFSHSVWGFSRLPTTSSSLSLMPLTPSYATFLTNPPPGPAKVYCFTSVHYIFLFFPTSIAALQCRFYFYFLCTFLERLIWRADCYPSVRPNIHASGFPFSCEPANKLSKRLRNGIISIPSVECRDDTDRYS